MAQLALSFSNMATEIFPKWMTLVGERKVRLFWFIRLMLTYPGDIFPSLICCPSLRRQVQELLLAHITWNWHQGWVLVETVRMSLSHQKLLCLGLCWMSGQNFIFFPCFLCFPVKWYFLPIRVVIYTEFILILWLCSYGKRPRRTLSLLCLNIPQMQNILFDSSIGAILGFGINHSWQ